MTLPGEKIVVVYDDDGEMDWDWWMELSEAQTDAVLAQAEEEYTEWWNGLSRLEQYRHMRRRRLEGIKRRRELLRDHPYLADLDIFKHDGRIGLLKARDFLRTGVYPQSDE